MTVRLRWNQAGLDHGGAFVLHDTPLFLLVSAGGDLDRLHQDPENRAGLVAEDSGNATIKMAGRGGLGFLVNGKVRDLAELPFGENMICSFEEQQWTLNAEGKGPVADPLIGTDLGGYRILDRLGNGSVGVVYRALQINLDREVALKILDPKAAKKSPLAVVSFKREAVAAGRLSHPNLVQVYDVGFERGLHFFAMELVPGGDLEQQLHTRGPLPWREALLFVADCVEALRFAREHHLVHRDVKPENLMLTIDGRTKLADLGMAATRGMVEKQGAGGTPHFMAPECVSGEHIDFRSDFYSLGCTLFRLLSGKTPFDGESVRDILRAHRDLPVPSLKEYGIDAPPAVQEFIAWLMAKNPDARPADAEEISHEIQSLLETKRSNGLLMGVVAIAVIAIGVSLYSVLTKDQDSVIVEVESADAEKARARNAKLQEEIAYTRAMALSEGEERELALLTFLSDYPSSQFRFQAIDELDRLGQLPAPGSSTPTAAQNDANQAQAQQRTQLAKLEEQLQVFLDRQEFGQAQAILAASALGADLLMPLWSRVDNLRHNAASSWTEQHADFLTREQWPKAAAVRAAFGGSMEGALRGVSEWQEQLQALETQASNAEAAALQRDFDQVRFDAVRALQDQVLVAVERMDFTAAKGALEQASERCTHEALAAALQQYSQMFADAQTVMDAIYARLDGTGQMDFTEPVDGKRAFAIKATAEGVEIMVQVRGERIARTDPWHRFRHPQTLATFLEEVLGPAQGAALGTRHSLMLLLAEASLARDLQSWGANPPSQDAAFMAAQSVAQWLDGLQTTQPLAQPKQAEILALQQMLELSEALADADSYAAMLHARDLGTEFSLLSVWSSNGASSWGFKP